MSKRVSNSRSRTKARNGRIRIGWRKAKMLDNLDKLRDRQADEQVQAYLYTAKQTLGKLFPTRVFHRHQDRG